MSTLDSDAFWRRLSERFEATAAAFAAEVREAPARADELLALVTSAPVRLVRGWHRDPRYRSLALARELLLRARHELERLRPRPEAALPLLQLALRALPAGSAGAGELRGEILCETGEAWRLAGADRQAEGCFGRAARALADSPDPGARALLCGRLARLRVDQLRGDEAVALFQRAVALSEELGDERGGAALRVELGLAKLLVGDLPESLETLATFLPQEGRGTVLAFSRRDRRGRPRPLPERCLPLPNRR